MYFYIHAKTSLALFKVRFASLFFRFSRGKHFRPACHSLHPLEGGGNSYFPAIAHFNFHTLRKWVRHILAPSPRYAVVCSVQIYAPSHHHTPRHTFVRTVPYQRRTTIGPMLPSRKFESGSGDFLRHVARHLKLPMLTSSTSKVKVLYKCL